MLFFFNLLASALAVRFIVESDDSTLNGKGVVDQKINNGELGLFFSDNAAGYLVDSFENTVYTYHEGSRGVYFLGKRSFDLIFSYLDAPTMAKIRNGYLTLPDEVSNPYANDVFYACDQLNSDNDPNHIASASNRGISVYTAREKVPSTCTAIKLKATD